MNTLKRLSSLRLTFGVFVFFLLGILFCHFAQLRFSPVVVACCFFLVVNLVATLVANEGFRRQPALLAFHVALLAVVCLVAVGRLMYLRGHAEVLDGQAFEGRLVHLESGGWHPSKLDTIRFVNHGFQVRYAPGLKRLETRNMVSWANEQGGVERAVIGDDKPLVLNGYRFYTTWNKGFALLFEWQSNGGEQMLGSVNLPGYPANALKQAQQWWLPGLPQPVWAMLQFEGELIPVDRDGEFRVPEDYRVVVRYGEQRWELQSGENNTVDLPGGRLRYVGLRTWMGYLVTWDGTIPWLLASCALAVLALGLHFWNRFSQRPWNPD